MQRDAAGNIQRLTYDITGQLQSIQLELKEQGGQNVLTRAEYNAVGQVLEEENGNGMLTRFSGIMGDTGKPTRVGTEEKFLPFVHIYM